jgi:hypothetical protein
VGITYRPPRKKITITVVVEAEQLLAVAGVKREKWLDEQAGVALKLPAKVKTASRRPPARRSSARSWTNAFRPTRPADYRPVR